MCCIYVNFFAAKLTYFICISMNFGGVLSQTCFVASSWVFLCQFGVQEGTCLSHLLPVPGLCLCYASSSPSAVLGGSACVHEAAQWELAVFSLVTLYRNLFLVVSSLMLICFHFSILFSASVKRIVLSYPLWLVSCL